MYKSEQESKTLPPLENVNPESWIEALPFIVYKDERLSGFQDLFLQFYNQQSLKGDQTVRRTMDVALRCFFDQYEVGEAIELSRFYVFSTVLTESNERRGKNGQLKTERKNEFDINGIPFPTVMHTTRVMKRGLNLQKYDIDGNPEGKKGVKPVTAMKMNGHDLYEDCSMTVAGVRIETDVLVDIICSEFLEGKRIAHSIIGMTKHEQLPPEIESAVLKSLLFECMVGFIPENALKDEASITINNKVIAQKHYDDIMKTITSLLRLRLEAYGRYKEDGDLREYLDEILDNIISKGFDVLDNLPTGVSFFSELRARMIATLFRVLLLKESDEIMQLLALQTTDPLFENLKNKSLAEAFQQPHLQEEMNKNMQDLILEQFGISVRAATGFRISFLDEVVSSDDMPEAVAQILVEVNPEDYDNLIEKLSLLAGTDQMRKLANSVHPLILEKYSGVLQRIIHVLGRRNSMFEIKEVYEDSTLSDVKLYIRVVEKQPYLWTRVLQGEENNFSSPEEKLLAPPEDQEYAIEAFLNTQLLLFNAEYFRGKGEQVAFMVWEGGVVSCRNTTGLRAMAEAKGLTNDAYEWVDLMSEESVDMDIVNPHALPIYYRRKKLFRS